MPEKVQILPPVPALTENTIRAFAEMFLGYGELDSPYWFIGTEPGLDNADAFLNWMHLWDSWGRPRIVCNRRAHLESGYTQWHRRNPKPQSTWRPLMLALCEYLGEYRTQEESLFWIKRYQERFLGCENGQTALLELGALNAPNRSAPWPYILLGDKALNSRESYASNFLGPRAETLGELAARHRPQFVWMYGARAEYRRYWTTIARGAEWCTDASVDGMEYRIDNGIVYVMTDHVTYHRTNEHWVSLGRLLKNLVDQSQARASTAC